MQLDTDHYLKKSHLFVIYDYSWNKHVVLIKDRFCAIETLVS